MNEQLYHWFGMAQRAKKLAYAPYSNFKVGAAVFDDTGFFNLAGNIEGSSSTVNLCAERIAIAKCLQQNAKPTILVITSDNKDIVCPCGMCRQFIIEFDTLKKIVMFNDNGSEVWETTPRKLIPRPYHRRDKHKG